MSEKEVNYEPIRSDIYIGSRNADVVWSRAEETTKLDRIERKLDKLLNLVEGKELSVKIDGAEIIDAITKADRLKRARI
ncbi:MULTISPECIES: hypothetical protein [Bhargavaea]|uniref:Uncharacterized protein n=1 Tax=Bhargavaea changchunensis TaxID=2134037 RepID=A0ABW2NB95_9BACL|nr:hypothetical protein [Bhargavaea sp. CC-171006]